MKTVIVWYRNDLRVHDHPALSIAAQDGTVVVPVFVLSDDLLSGKRSGSNRNRFLLESLQDVRTSLQNLGSDLIILHGTPNVELPKLAQLTSAEAVYYTADYTPYSLKRDKNMKSTLDTLNIEFRSFPGRLAVSTLDKLHTKTGTIHKVFTPFYKNWLEIQRRAVAELPKLSALPKSVDAGRLPELESITLRDDLSERALPGGETAGRKRLAEFIETDIEDYRETNNDMAADRTSRLSPYLHFGCVSPREVETLLPENSGAAAWHRQLAWREFYHYIMYNNPKTITEPFQERYSVLSWDPNPAFEQAWQDGKTGFPIVDAAMRQIKLEGWMHNRGRLITASFYTKQLWLDWHNGEAYFMKMLLDGDTSNNVGNWQWITSIGVDPAPVYRRLYNPTLQQQNYDPTGAYVRKYVPELQNVPDKYLAEPWTMPAELQEEIGCKMGTNYPNPIVDHKLARLAALERYQAVPRVT
ncbi:MAG: deoxyribodipyrimidine photo-lyase [Patescibacteria group bacterium]|nr:deoxyribodipyrimidine photo-lyase [Patescibacteria group bacterium]